MKKAIVVLIVILSFYQLVYSQEFQYLQFRVEDGLKTDIIKSIDRDSIGFIWIGSDDGLMQYNGNEFIHYPYATESPFIKDFVKLKSGRLLVLNDLGLDEIINQVDTVIFRNILPGTRVPTDTSIWYPKSIFEDSSGNLWISEPQSVVRYDGTNIKRIEFGVDHYSTSFVRSFAFTELPGSKILISSYNSSLFIYDNETGEFEFLDNERFSTEINHLIYWNNQVYIASTDGMFTFRMDEQGKPIINQALDVSNVSYLLPINDQTLLVSTFTSSTFLYNVDGTNSAVPQSLTVVNQTFKSEDGNIWLATEKGVVLMKPKIFRKISADVDNIYVESVVISENERTVFFSSKEHIRKYDIETKQTALFDHRRNGYFLSMRWMDDHLWTSNATSIYKYGSNGDLLKSRDFGEEGRFIFDIMFDKNKILWFTQESGIGLKSIDQDGKVKFYREDQGIKEETTVVRVGEKGIYTGTTNPESYLYFKDYSDTVFRNISRPITFDYAGDFRINDIAVDDENSTIWLATSIGLLRQTNATVEKIYFEDKFDNLLVKTVQIQENSPFVWYSNAYGLIQFNAANSEYNVYDESHGLPSNTISTRGLVVKDDAIWIGTASGLAYSDHDFMHLGKTPKPYILLFNVDEEAIKTSELNKKVLPAKPNIGISISSPTYPSNSIKYQYKFEGKDGTWLNLPYDYMVLFAKMKSGKYSISFRAKKPGNYSWSEESNYKFTIEKAYYEKWYFIAGIFVVAFLLVIITRYISVKILMERQQELEKLVAERTAELENVNTNLIERNQELDQFVYSTSHDLSAPLKSIRGLINIANYENDISAQKALLKRMDESVVKLETFIRDVISYSRNARLEIKEKDIKLRQLVIEILDHLSNLDNFQKIKFDIRIDEDLIIRSDETRLKIVLNNLLSNAVKFQRFDEAEMPLVHIGYWYEKNKHFIKVSDNGHGIPKEFLEKIFNMFYRANVGIDGSGLGLYILKETLKKLKGDVQVKSKEGIGSEFVVSFPEIGQLP